MKTAKFALIAGLAVLLASCCVCRKGLNPKTSITDIKWTVIQVGSEPANADGNFYLELSGTDDKAAGRGDCNSFNGTYVADSYGNLRFGQMASTRAFCANQQLEDKYLAALSRVDGYSLVEPNVLVLLNDDIAEVVLQAY